MPSPDGIPGFRSAFPGLFPESKPWLILGKGPSFTKFPDMNVDGFHRMGLNHVCMNAPVDVAHVVDIDVLEQCGPDMLRQCRYLVMPWVPHMRHRPSLLTPTSLLDAGGITLSEWLPRSEILSAFAREGRLFWYNLESGAAMRNPLDGEIVKVSGFSASAAINLLAACGVQTIRTLGVDGGNAYSDAFRHLNGTTLLANGHENFDVQFRGIAQSIVKHNLDLAPLDIESPITVFVGAEPAQMLAFKVLEHSIRKHASMSVVVTPLFDAVQEAGISVPEPVRPELRGRTPFSYQRFAIPALKGYRGRAIYIDSDMQVFDDIKKLWTIPFDGAPLLAVQERGKARLPQYSVMLLDCEALNWNVQSLVDQLDEGRWTYEEFMYDMAAAPGARAGIPSRWNDLERFIPGETALIHYTDMDQQPWLETNNANGRVWMRGLLDAMADGAVTREFVEQEVAAGHIRPSLLAQIDEGIVDPLALGSSIRRLDAAFLPPHVMARHERRNFRPASIQRIRFKRKLRMELWRLANKLRLWEVAKYLRSKVKALRQRQRMAIARRSHGLPS